MPDRRPPLSIDQPSVCVVMCTFNGASHLPEQLESILVQTRCPSRMVVVDDASTDNTAKILQDFAHRAPFPVQIEINQQNIGFRKNFEKAVRLSEGDILVLSDQDDIWLSTRLERSVQPFADPTVSLLFSDAEVVGPGLEPRGVGLWDSVGLDARKLEMVRDGRALELLTRGYWVTGATMSFRGTWKDLVVPVDDVLVHDAWMALLLSAVGRVVAIRERLVLYRQHDRNQIGAPRTTARERAARVRLIGRKSLCELRDGLDRARLRLEERGAMSPGARAILGDAIEHLNIRSSLPMARLHRIPMIYRELVSGRYARRANGLSSAFRDLLV